MRLEKRNGQWWIADVPGSPDQGPYSDRWEADDDMEGLQRYETLKPHEISVDSPLARRIAGAAVQLELC